MKKSTNKRLPQKSIVKLARTRKILCFLAELSVEYFEMWYDAQDFRSALLSGGKDYVRFIKEELTKKKYRQTLYQLKRSKCIKVRSIGDSMHIKLTDKGWRTSLTDRIRTAPNLPPENICLVAFDIPESQRELRARFRRFLRSCGFRMQQKSLWLSEKNVSQLIQEAIKKMGATEWIQVYMGHQIKN